MVASLCFRLPSIDYTESTTVQEWLESIKMGQYTNNFAEAGYEKLKEVTSLNSADLQRLGIKLIGHKNKICKSVKEVSKSLQKKTSIPV